ncbi:MAG: hypothetical protein J6P74_08720 [Paludibacteraceae bacterium]|nr:hypothetical protein [Paludibacteraceae bacterium]
MAELVNKKFKLTAQVLTPLHIGSGAEKDWVAGVDYISKDGMLWHLDMNRMVAAGVNMDMLASMFATGKTDGVEKLIGAKLKDVSDFQMRLPVSSANPIKVFLRNQLSNNPVLAGSSLKGAIRSVLFTDMREHKDTRNEDVFGKLKDGADFMRFIRVGDIEFPHDATCLVNTKIYNLQKIGSEWQGSWKHGANFTNAEYNPVGFNTLYECLIPGKTAEGTIGFEASLFDKQQGQIAYQTKKHRVLNDVNALCEIIRDHTFDNLDKELDFFEQYEQGEYSSDIFNSIIEIQEAINACRPNECVIKMSAGAGFNAITGDWQFDDYVHGTLDRKRNRGNDVKPKSRKVAIMGQKMSLMGFVKLTFVEE